jgi:hypothetical protein
MIWDLDDLLDEIGVVIRSSLRDLEAGKTITSHRVMGDDQLKVTASFSVRPAIPESRPTMPSVAQEPLVDVFHDESGLRVVVELPGIRKEDVSVRFLGDMLRIEVSKGGKTHRLDVPCVSPPGGIKVESTTHNNSVVEIRFLRSGDT